MLRAQSALLTTLVRLLDRELLKPDTAFTIVRAFHNNVPVHRMRAGPIPDAAAAQWDENLYTFIAQFAGPP